MLFEFWCFENNVLFYLFIKFKRSRCLKKGLQLTLPTMESKVRMKKRMAPRVGTNFLLQNLVTGVFPHSSDQKPRLLSRLLRFPDQRELWTSCFRHCPSTLPVDPWQIWMSGASSGAQPSKPVPQSDHRGPLHSLPVEENWEW